MSKTLNMTDEEKKSRIADLIGCECGYNEDGTARLYRHPHFGDEIYWRGTMEPFDPLNDLNAMHEAEKVLEGWQVVNYKDNLVRVVSGELTCSGFDLLNATARQRADAFLLTMGEPTSGPASSGAEREEGE